MIAVVTGGASSGKSAYAETLSLTMPGPHAYAATMRPNPGDPETEARIARHRFMRAGKGFETIELVTDTVPACASPESAAWNTVLLEDLGNIVANNLEHALEAVLTYPNVVIVANEVGHDGVRYDKFTQSYIEQIGALACQLAQRADLVVEVVAGQPFTVKGARP